MELRSFSIPWYCAFTTLQLLTTGSNGFRTQGVSSCSGCSSCSDSGRGSSCGLSSGGLFGRGLLGRGLLGPAPFELGWLPSPFDRVGGYPSGAQYVCFLLFPYFTWFTGATTRGGSSPAIRRTSLSNSRSRSRVIRYRLSSCTAL